MMDAILTEVAIQLKGNLAFLLGLGGMFTIVKAILTSLLLLPEVKSDRSSIRTKNGSTRAWLWGLGVASVLLFVVVLWLYFGSAIATIDADALKTKRQALTEAQRWYLGWLVLLSILLVIAEGASSVLRHRLSVLAAKE